MTIQAPSMAAAQARCMGCATGASQSITASTAVLSRWDSELQSGTRNGATSNADHAAADLFLRKSFRNIRRNLAELTDNDDRAVLATANSVLGKSPVTSGPNGH